MSDVHIFSVSEITRTIKLLLEENIPTIWVEGEVSNFKAHYSGHFYFTLKDENSQISAVMWRSRAQQNSFEFEDGMKIQALGNIRLYEKSGRYQIDVIRMQPAGVGQLQLKFEQLKQQLLQEGLFDETHKITLPEFAGRIGVVTSGTGAAIRDILNVLKRGAPNVQIIVNPAKVQGVGAAQEIVKAIEQFNQYGEVDLLIVGRGGGSLEDLWAFNEEIVARAIYKSKIPIISAVGHEVDFTIADFVADLRAPTPSAAAELAVPDYNEIGTQLRYTGQRLQEILLKLVQRNRDKVVAFENSYGLRRIEDRVRQYALQIDDLNGNLERFYFYGVKQNLDRVRQLSQRLNNLNPRQVLKRGYSITYHDNRVVTHTSQVKAKEELRTELSDGYIFSSVRKTKKESGNAQKEADI